VISHLANGSQPKAEIGLAAKPSISKNTARIAIEVAYHEMASNRLEWIDHKHASVVTQASDRISLKSSLSVATWEDHGSIRALFFYVTEDHG